MLQTDKAAGKTRLRNILSVAGSTAVIIVSLSVLCAFSIVKNVEIDTGYGQVRSVVTMKNTVGELLDEQQITLNEGDVVLPGVNSGLQHEQKISIDRAVSVKITVDGIETKHRTVSGTVEEVLKESGVVLENLDECNYPVKDKVFDNMEIVVSRVKEATVTEETTIQCNVIRKNDANLAKGTEKVIQEGQDGVLKSEYSVVTRDGIEISRKLLSEETAVQPVDKIISVGTKLEFGSVVPASELKSKKVLTMNATAYDIGYESCGKNPGDPGYGITATGIRACYGIVAVDPSVIPLGSKLYITSADGSYVYGYALAADTGGAIKGSRIDLCYNSRAEALQFGRRNVLVYIL